MDSSAKPTLQQSLRKKRIQHPSSSIRPQHSFSSEHGSSKPVSMRQSIRTTQQSSYSTLTSQSLRHQQSSSSMFPSQHDSSKPVNMMQSIRTQQSSSSTLTSHSFRHQQSPSSMISSEHRSSKPLSMTQSIRTTQHSSFSGHASQCISTHRSSSSENVSFRKLVLPNHLHRHALTLTAAAGAPYSCNGCKEAGFGRSYRCENKGCSYVLHEECADAVLQCKNPVSHSFFEEEKFWFLEKPLGYPRVCDACRMDVLGFVYHRYDNGHPDDTGLDLHPCCLKLRDNVSYRDLDETKTLRLHRNVPKKCVRCKSRKVGDDSRVKGWSYLTCDGDCYHVSCFKELFLEKLRDDYFSEKKIVVSKMQSNVVESNNMKVVKVGEGSNNSMKMVGKIAPVVLKLIFSAIFGDPVSFVLALVEALATSSIN